MPGVSDASDRCQCRPHDKGDRDGAIDVDAEQGRHLAILFTGALRASEWCSLNKIPKTQQQHECHQHDNDLLGGYVEATRSLDPAGLRCGRNTDQAAIDQRWQWLVARTLHDLHEIHQEDRHADRRNQRCQSE